MKPTREEKKALTREAILESAARLLRDNLLIYGVGGLVAPFIGIKLIDMLLTFLKLA